MTVGDAKRKRGPKSRPAQDGDKAAGGKGLKKARVEISAGGIVYRRTPKGVRVALIQDPYGKWSFAKGKQEPGETIEETAMRETREEMGLKNLKIVAPVGKIDFWYRERFRPELKGTLIHKHVHFFLMETDPDAKGKPQKKERIRRIIWVPPYRMAAKSSYDDVKSVVVKAKAILARRFGKKRRRDGAGKKPANGKGPGVEKPAGR